MPRLLSLLLLASLSTVISAAADTGPNVLPLVKATHQASLAAREQVLRKTVARNTSWPDGAWGEVLWCLAALHLDEKTELANERLLARAQTYIVHKNAGKDSSTFEPGNTRETPWAYFAITDYVRILCLFRADSPHFPGRLQPATEAAMKEALWHWVKTDSRLDHTTMQDLLLLLGTENHDLTRRPNHYLIASILKDDPEYRDRRFDDGHTAAEHAEAYRKFYQAWPRLRARTGMWFELGSDTYQKYSWPALFNLHELAPDELVRKRFGMLLDLAFIEEAQISVRGLRGGGRSRAGFGKHGFTSYKDLLYAPEDNARGASHSNVLETSRYQLPAAAILLRKQVFPASRPFAIRNRVLGELEPARPGDPGNRFAADSALVNYAWRTPHYLLGSTLQNPSLTMPSPDGGAAIVKYGGISIQNRWCGILFDNPASEEVCAVYPVIDKTRGGRPQHPHWSVQFQNVLVLQRIPPRTRKRPGSYSTGAVGIRFHGQELQKSEENGWIFATDGKAFVGVKFLDGPHEWNEDRTEARPSNFKHSSDTSRILLHAGDIATHQSFENFRTTVLANPLKTSAEKVDYHFDAKRQHLEATRYHPDRPGQFVLPRINGTPVNLHPPMTYESPFLNGKFGSDKVTITVSPIKRVLDFSR